MNLEIHPRIRGKVDKRLWDQMTPLKLEKKN